jgi:hypothetical protein
MNLTIYDLFKTFGVSPNKARLVRHTNKEINVLDAFHNNKELFEEYTAWQKPDKFGDAELLAIFSPARGTTSMFLGIWKICGVTLNRELQPSHLELLQKNKLPERWFKNSVRYHLGATELMSDLSERLVIEWGKVARNWVQKQNKSVVQIKPINSIGDFTSYDKIRLSYQDLKKLRRDTDSNQSWVNALSSVNGVYLVKYNRDGRLYVGSAYGRGGILGRWFDYGKSGDAGNKKLIGLDANEFEFSILEICPTTMSNKEVIARENRWKDCLGTREFGLNILEQH